MSPASGAAGRAALSVCESILLSLTENRVIAPTEARAILEDAASAHREAARLGDEASEAHAETAALLDDILKHGNAVRHGDRDS